MSPNQIPMFNETEFEAAPAVPDPFRRLSSIPGMSEKARRLINSIPDEKIRKDLLSSIDLNFKRLEGFDLLAVLVPVLESFEKKFGEACPVCGANPKKYRRRIRETLSRDLVRLYRLGLGFHHVRDFTDGRNSSDFSIVELFGLAKPKPNVDNPKRRTLGFWELTDLGARFVRNEIGIPRFLMIEGGKVVETSSGLSFIIDSIGKDFDYSDVIQKGE